MTAKVLSHIRKKFVAVVGMKASGKSTVIQSVSGCKNRKFEGLIRDHSTGLALYVIASSPQESQKKEAAFRKSLAKVVAGPSIQGLITAIQPTNPTKRMSMERMIDLARQLRMESYVFVLDPPYNGSRNGPTYDVIRKRVLRSDPNAQVVKLDGHRFAVLNAEAIRALSRLPY